MQLLDLTLASPAENLALDEALLETAEAAKEPFEVLRLWQSAQPIVVVGRSSRVNDEVHRERCERLGIPILRRSSGGASVVAGPGCLMYAVVLSYERRPALRMIEAAHRFVLGMCVTSLERLIPGIRHQGTSDLTLRDRKVSGNSLRCKRNHLLYHGTLLFDFPLALIESCLRMPPRQPEYRSGRGHEQFVTNLPADELSLRCALVNGWNASELLERWPEQLTEQLAADKYRQIAWNYRH